jgi:hypothetical protein
VASAGVLLNPEGISSSSSNPGSSISAGSAGSTAAAQQGSDQQQRIRLFIGVFTGFNGPAAANGTKYNYALRRQALRETWFPGGRQHLDW